MNYCIKAISNRRFFLFRGQLCFLNFVYHLFHFSTKYLLLLHIFLLYHKYYYVDMFYSRSSQYEASGLLSFSPKDN